MNKRLLMLSMTGCLTLGALVSCDSLTGKKDDAGRDVIVSIGNKNYTAEELFDNYSETTTGAAAYYNAIYDVLVRHAVPVTATIENTVNTQIDDFTRLATVAANNNGTSYRTELSNALIGEGVEDLDQLRELYILKEQKKKFEENYYDKMTDTKVVKTEGKEAEAISMFEKLSLEYFNTKTPYHIKHILVKVSADSSFYNGKISKDDAKKIARVIKLLSSDLVTFGNVAKTESDDNSGDKSSANNFGSLGIMDRDTSFVSEFKYAVYQYDGLFNNAVSAEKKALLGIPGDQDIFVSNDETEGDKYLKVSSILNKDNINYIPYEKAMDLEKYAEVETNVNTYEKIEDGNADYYPRNIVFNNWFNYHGLSFIVKPTDPQYTVSDSRFKTFDGLDNEVLCDENGNPILVTRAGTPGDSGYEGIHFIVIEQSPLTATDGELLDYYSTDIPATGENVEGKRRFVTFIASDRTTYQEAAESIENSVKGFDSSIEYRMFKEEIEKSDVVINDKIKKLILDYKEEAILSNKYSLEQSNLSSWAAYLRKLVLQKSMKDAKVIGEDKIQLFYDNKE